MTDLLYAGIALGALSAICCSIIALAIVVTEVATWIDNQRTHRIVNERLAEDREVARLDAIPVPGGHWETWSS